MNAPRGTGQRCWSHRNQPTGTHPVVVPADQDAQAVLGGRSREVPTNTYRHKRPVFYAALQYAVKRKHLKVNPLTDDGIDFTPPKAVEAVDPRTVPNPGRPRRSSPQQDR